MRRNFFRTLLAFVLIASFLVLPAYADNATVSGSKVNVRSGPGVSFPVKDCLPRNTAVTVTDRSNGDWYAIEYDGNTGFMSSRYLDMDGEIIIEAEGAGFVSSSQTTAYVSAMYVRFRSGPSSSSSVLGEYNTGKEVSVLETSGDWTKCIINGKVGYIYSDYISESYPSYDPAPEEDGIIVLGSSGSVVLDEPEDLPVNSGSSGGSSANDNIVVDPQPETKPESTPAPTPEATPLPSPEVSEQEEQDGVINAMYVRFRSGPGTSYSILGTYNQGKALTATGISGDWTRCLIDGREGYIHTDYVSLYSGAAMPDLLPDEDEEPEEAPDSPEQEEVPATPPVQNVEAKPGYISGNNVRMRSAASTNSKVLAELSFGNTVTITGISGEWTAVSYEGKNGFVFSSYVKEGAYKPSSSGGSASGREIADFALQFVGYNYRWGGKDPSTGFDCSGLMYYVYQQFGYTLNRIACDQARNGVHVDPSDLQPGDLLCFYSGGSYIGHVGMYIGDNQFVHASTSTTGVIISELSGYYANRGFEARRII